jgi:predicted Zn-dependent peptidase
MLIAGNFINFTCCVRSLTRQDLADYIRLHYKGSRMVLAAAGGVKHETLVDLASKHLGALGGKVEGALPQPPAYCRFTGMENRKKYIFSPFFLL